MSFERLVVTPEKWKASKTEVGSPAVRAGDLLFVASQHSVEGNVREAGPGCAGTYSGYRDCGGRDNGSTSWMSWLSLSTFAMRKMCSKSAASFSPRIIRHGLSWERRDCRSEDRRCIFMPWPISARTRNNALRPIAWPGGVSIPFPAPAAKANTSLYRVKWRQTLMATLPTPAITRSSHAIFFIGSRN